ncbi:MAG: hypothetical protein KDD56_07080 [Bdellovibrionales bacterium]|nr:hypothetical protein [Bdellovibrionales bacterium]
MIILIISIVEALLLVGVMFFLISSKKAQMSGFVDGLKGELEQREELKQKFEEVYTQMIPFPDLAERVAETKSYEESLKAERGRITITQAELETVEARLRELDEIERELEASALETKEELNILQKKEKDLASKNDKLKLEIETSNSKLTELMSELELSAEIDAEVQAAQAELLQTQEKIDILILQIEGGNEQYFILKRRYDALDIEYAQLYEKFAEADGG